MAWGDGSGVFKDSGGKPVMVDGLLCSIMKAISRSPPYAELVAVIEKDTCESEVKRFWEILFTHFDVEDHTTYCA